MALILNETQAAERLASSSNLASRFNQDVSEIRQFGLGRGNGISHPIPDFIKVQVGTMSRLKTDSQQVIADAFGISQREVSHIKTGNPASVKEDVETAIQKNLGEVRDIAMEKLLTSLGCITEEKMENSGAQALSTIARNLSSVVEKTMPQATNQGVTQLLIYAPQMKDEKSYKTIEV